MNAVAVWAVPGHEQEARDFMRRAGFDIADQTTHWFVPVAGGTHAQACELVAERLVAVDPRWTEYVTIREPSGRPDKEN